jgi:hypothetical protein
MRRDGIARRYRHRRGNRNHRYGGRRVRRAPHEKCGGHNSEHRGQPHRHGKEAHAERVAGEDRNRDQVDRCDVEKGAQ